MNRVKNFLLSSAAVLVLAACQTAPPVTETPDLSFTNLPVINLNVARIEVVDNYRPSLNPPHVDHLFRQPPVQVAKQMIDRQLVANGSNGTLRITIDDASVIRRDLPVTEGIEGTFQNEPAEEYKARVALKFELLDESATGNASVTSDRTKTLMEDASPADRDMAYVSIDEQIMRDLKEGFGGVVRNTFGWK